MIAIVATLKLESAFGSTDIFNITVIDAMRNKVN